MDINDYFDNPDSDECKEWLVESLKKHIITGESMDACLGLHTVGYTTPSARTKYFRMKRDEAITSAWNLIRITEEGWTDRQCTKELFRKLADPKNKGELIVEINMCTEKLGGDGYNSIDALHKVCTRTMDKIYELLDTSE